MMSSSTTSILIFGRAPQEGRVKTRLGAEVGMAEAADLYAQLLAYTLRMSVLPDSQRILFLPPEDRAFGEALQQMDPSLQISVQEGNDLGERMDRAFQERFAAGDKRALLIGSDCPYLTELHLVDALRRFSHCDVVFGPAGDGGYYLVGQQNQAHPIFSGIPWSSSQTWLQTKKLLSRQKIPYATIPPLDDIDDLTTLRRYLQSEGPCPLILPPKLRTLLH